MERDITGTLFDPEILISQQYLKIYRQTKPAEAEKRLMLAVLVDAVQTYQKFASSRSAPGKALFREAEAWFRREEPDCVFSFSSICEVLGLNPPFLRRGLLQGVEDRKRRGPPRKVQLRAGVGRTRKPTLSPERRAS
jgi:hypothetical protein